MFPLDKTDGAKLNLTRPTQKETQPVYLIFLMNLFFSIWQKLTLHTFDFSKPSFDSMLQKLLGTIFQAFR